MPRNNRRGLRRALLWAVALGFGLIALTTPPAPAVAGDCHARWWDPYCYDGGEGGLQCNAGHLGRR